MTGRRLLFVEDDATLRRVLTRELQRFGYVVQEHADPDHALASLASFRPELALIDLRLPGIGGMGLLPLLLASDADLQVAVLTGHGAVPEAVEAMRQGASDFLTKPCSLDVLEASLRRMCQRRDLLEENQRLRRLSGGSEVGDLIGNSEPVVRLRELVDRLAGSPAHVLVQGENGTGKELVARRIHQLSGRRDGPFVVVNCGAIPAGLVESELFGHERGAFTGADRRRIGLIEASHGGTLFLDEVGELPLPIQAALLRALQFGEVRQVGGTEPRHVDLRVVAATNRNLLDDIRNARFREDLYYRLAALLVQVPPLRERGGDIELLARRFLAGQVPPAGRALRFDDAAVAALGRHDWPGNVRELQNTVTRLAVLATGDVITAADVERHIVRTDRIGDRELPTLDLDSLERLAVLQAMRECGDDKPKAARLLGVALKTLYNKLAAYRRG